MATECVTTVFHAVKRVERRSLQSAGAVRNIMREKSTLQALKGVRKCNDGYNTAVNSYPPVVAVRLSRSARDYLYVSGIFSPHNLRSALSFLIYDVKQNFERDTMFNALPR